jgi:hypothetical protein
VHAWHRDRATDNRANEHEPRKVFQEHIHGLFRRISANVNASKDKVKDRIDLV